MLKTKISLTFLALSLIAGLMFVGPVYALTNQVQIQELPAYVNTNNFKLSCSAITNALTDSNLGTTTMAQFYVTPSGGSETSFGSAIDLSVNACQVQVTDSQIGGETSYTFTVKLDTGESSSTTTIYDHSGPGTVSGYYKEGLGDGFKLHWTNPSDSDFSKVIIYRGESVDFTADSSHEVVTLPSGGGSPMTYEDHFSIDTSKTYFYDLRAVDKAGNSGNLVGDGQVTTVVTTPTPQAGGRSGSVTQLPIGVSSGSVLGTESSPTPEAEGLQTPQGGVVNQINQFAKNTPQPLRWILTHKKISLGVAALLMLLGYTLYRRSKKNI
jgi:hypothetical protein